MNNRPANDPRLLRLNPADNVVTVLSPLAAGERVFIDGVETAIAGPISLGHKLAARRIAAGEKVVKYGAPIGSATRDIACGEHVHTYNLKSDYLPTFLREDQSRYFGAASTGS
jgi:altronate dehydratase small subunit